MMMNEIFPTHQDRDMIDKADQEVDGKHFFCFCINGNLALFRFLDFLEG